MESDTEYKVYRLISPSGKTYIGITGTSVKKRWSSHVRRAYKEHRNHPLYNAIRKYGPDNFRVEIIETTTDKEEALQLEKYYISIIDEDKKYNISRGGEFDSADGGKHFWEEIRKNPDKYNSYISRLSFACKIRDIHYPYLVEHRAVKAQTWRKENPKEAWKLSYRAIRIANRLKGQPKYESVETKLNTPKTKEELRRRYKHNEIRSEAAKKGWKNSSQNTTKIRCEKISKKASIRMSNMSDEERRRQTEKARNSIDRKSQGKAASNGLKKYWEELKADPSKYSEYRKRRGWKPI